MTGKQVWYPDRSLTAERTSQEQEEGGRGSSCRQPQAVTTKTRARTVVKPKKSVNSVVATEPCPDSYPTVESSSGDQSILDYSDITNGHGRNPSTPEFCGWRESDVMMILPAPRRTCQTPADGLRSALHSRLGSRSTPSQRQRPVAFEFQHFLDTHEHIDHYRTHYCFTTLSLSSLLQSGADDHQPETVEQDKESLLKPEVRSLYRGDLYLRELACRLGVGESIKEPQLLHTPKRTPPSIVKKSRQKTDLIIDVIARNTRVDEDEDDPGTPASAWESPPVESPSRATPLANRPGSKYKPDTPLELPKIPEVSHVPQRRDQRNKSSSIISINKYLRVTSQGDSVEGEEGSGHTLTHVPTATSLSTSSVTSCEKEVHPLPPDNKDLLSQTHKDTLISKHPQPHKDLLLSEHPQPDKDLLLSEHPQPHKDVLLSEHAQPDNQVVFKPRGELFSMDRTQKEKMITNKAHSLGLISRGWSRTPSSKQVLTNYLSHQRQGNQSRPDTRQRERHRGVIDHSTGQSYQDNKEKQYKERIQSSSKPRPQSRMTGEGREKLDRLKTIYDSSARGKRLKKPISRCTSRAATRPATRLSDNGRSLTRRPATRMDMSGLAGLEESAYWNELPGQRSTQPQRSQGTNVKRSKDKFSPMSLAIELSHSHDKHMVTTATRVKSSRHKRTVNETIAPGATPQQISEHLFRLKRKFEGVLNVQRRVIQKFNS